MPPPGHDSAMGSFTKIAGMAIVFLLLAGFFAWVMIEMASFSHGGNRLDAIAIGFGIVALAMGLSAVHRPGTHRHD